MAAGWSLLLSCLLLLGCAPAAPVQTAAEPGFHGSWLAEGRAVPETSFTDTGGAAFDLAVSPSKPVVLVLFGYSHCTEVCPQVLDTVTEARALLGDAMAMRVQVVVLSVDPDRDDPEALRAWLDGWDPGYTGLCGELDEVRAAAAELGVEVGARQDLAEGGYQVAHGSQLVGVDAERRARLVWPPDTTPEQLAEDLTTFIEEQQ